MSAFAPFIAVAGFALMMLIVWAYNDCVNYVETGWKRYTLTDDEWDVLRLHLQTLEKLNRG